MTTIRAVDSLKYGSRLFLYLLGVLVVGGGILGLGLALGLDHAQAALDGGGYSKTELAGGAVLSLIGSFALLTGLFGVVYKLVADSVAAGLEEVSEPATPTVTVDGEGTTRGTVTPDTGSTGPSPGEQTARNHGSGAPAASSESQSPDDDASDERAASSTTGEAVAAAEQSESSAETEQAAETEPTQPATESSAAGTESGPSGNGTERPSKTQYDETQPSATADSGGREESEGSSDTGTIDVDQPGTGMKTESWADETGDGVGGERDTESAPSSDEPSDGPSTDGPKRVPSPEEIAFGTDSSAEDDGDNDEKKEDERGATDERDDGGSKSTDTTRGGGSFGDDPLAGPGE